MDGQQSQQKSDLNLTVVRTDYNLRTQKRLKIE